jgi:hypothetical protein
MRTLAAVIILVLAPSFAIGGLKECGFLIATKGIFNITMEEDSKLRGLPPIAISQIFRSLLGRWVELQVQEPYPSFENRGRKQIIRIRVTGNTAPTNEKPDTPYQIVGWTSQTHTGAKGALPVIAKIPYSNIASVKLMEPAWVHISFLNLIKRRGRSILLLDGKPSGPLMVEAQTDTLGGKKTFVLLGIPDKAKGAHATGEVPLADIQSAKSQNTQGIEISILNLVKKDGRPYLALSTHTEEKIITLAETDTDAVKALGLVLSYFVDIYDKRGEIEFGYFMKALEERNIRGRQIVAAYTHYVHEGNEDKDIPKLINAAFYNPVEVVEAVNLELGPDYHHAAVYPSWEREKENKAKLPSRP